VSHKKLFNCSPTVMIRAEFIQLHCTETEEKNCFSFSDPMSVARGSIPTAAPAGKRCPEGTSALSVSICFPVKGTKGTDCRVGRNPYLTLEWTTEHFIIHWGRRSYCWESSSLLDLIKAGWLLLVPFSTWSFIFCQIAPVLLVA